eukprot:6172038-Pleurochrysis_carterae.AAC.2
MRAAHGRRISPYGGCRSWPPPWPPCAGAPARARRPLLERWAAPARCRPAELPPSADEASLPPYARPR